jgi:outer membrane biosynthesis protein TonB
VKAENPELNNKQIMTEMGNRWRNANEDTKKKYEVLASEDKERYLREKSAHADGCGASESKEVEPEEVVVEAPVPESTPVQKKKGGSKKKKTGEVVVEEPVPEPVPVPVPESTPAPVSKKGGNNGYINYSKLMRASVSAETGLDFKGTTAELSKRWKALSDEDKQKYKEGTPVNA